MVGERKAPVGAILIYATWNYFIIPKKVFIVRYINKCNYKILYVGFSET